MHEKKPEKIESRTGHVVIQPLITEVGKYEATDVQGFRQTADGRVTIIFGLVRDGEPFTLKDSNVPRKWNFWLDLGSIVFNWV